MFVGLHQLISLSWPFGLTPNNTFDIKKVLQNFLAETSRDLQYDSVLKIFAESALWSITTSEDAVIHF